VQLEGEGTDAEVFHYQLDHLGTPLALTRDNGATAWQVRYRAYGNVWREEIADVATPLRFQGQYFDDETGLHYNRHRYYQPETGRFITPDPIGLAGGLNNYQYAPNPIGWVDPLGLHNEIGICPGLKEQLLKSDSASEWGTLNDGANQGVKHFADYWEKFPERIPSLEQRLGLESGAFSPSVDGFKAFTDAAKKVVELSGANTKHLPDAKSIHYVPGKVKESKGVVVILRHGKLQSMMPSDLKSFGKMQ
ncbi:RHS repeat domain-containing protein, partial [Aeromonas veronii]|uniref:RHS repeat domain-containing protein n=1 Tax=Aeromonas veronii TaxID=654 RepID=UPI003D22999A